MPRWHGHVSGVVALLATLVFSSANAEAQEPGIRFDGSGSLVQNAGTTGTLTLLNDTGTTLSLAVQTVDGTGAPVAAPEATLAVPRIAPGAVVAITFMAGGARPGATGYVVAVATAMDGSGPPLVARRPFTIATPSSTMEPLVAKWSVTSYRNTPFAANPEQIPTEAGATCVPGQGPAVVGGISSTSGGGGPVEATCSATGVALAFPNLVEPGTYTGSIDLLPDTVDKGAVELTVLRTDDVLLPTLVLAIGIALALAAARQTGRISRLSEREQDALEVQADAAASMREFARRSRGTTWANYTYASDLSKQIAKVRDDLRFLRRGMTALDEKNIAYAQAGSMIDEVRTLVSRWPEFADRLAELRGALAAVLATGWTEPVFVEKARQLLSGEPVTVAAAVERIEETAASIDLAVLWQRHRMLLEDLEESVSRLEFDIPSGAEGRSMKAQLQKARELISSIRDGLLEATGSSDYAERGVAADVAALRAIVVRFKDRLPATAAGVGPSDAQETPGARPQWPCV